MPVVESDAYGPLIGLPGVEMAVIDVLRNPPVANGRAPLIVYMLAELERAYGLEIKSLQVPPASDSFRGGLDFETWKEDQLPALIVVVKPDGDPEYLDTAGTVSQVFEVQIAAVVEVLDDRSEDDSRLLAQHYGTAIMKAITLNRGLGWLDATETRLTGFAEPEFDDPDVRNLIRCVATFTTRVSPVLVATARPAMFLPDPYAAPQALPTVIDTDVTVDATLPA